MESTEEMAPFVTAHGCVWTPEMTLRSPAQLDKLLTILRALRGQMSWPHEDDPEREPAWMTPIVAPAEQQATALGHLARTLVAMAENWRAGREQQPDLCPRTLIFCGNALRSGLLQFLEEAKADATAGGAR